MEKSQFNGHRISETICQTMKEETFVSVRADFYPVQLKVY